MEHPNPQLRQQMQTFYQALRENDVETLEKLHQHGLPLDWVQSFAESSLPEYAMRHGAEEAAWWLMARGVMPENWASFTGETWKSFVRRGWSMVVNRNDESFNIPMDVYKDIVKMAIKTNGEKIPSWLESAVSTSTNQLGVFASSVFNRLSRTINAFMTAEVSTEDSPAPATASTKASPAPSTEPSPPSTVTKEVPSKKPVKKATKKSAKKATTKTSSKSVSKPSSNKPTSSGLGERIQSNRAQKAGPAKKVSAKRSVS